MKPPIFVNIKVTLHPWWRALAIANFFGIKTPVRWMAKLEIVK